MIDETLNRITPLAQEWLERAAARQIQLTKPPGSLGVLEDIANRLAAIRRTIRPTVSRRRIYVVAADHGLADTFDGCGGGWTKEQALEIMRDSRLGTYGALALVFLVLGKFSFLSAMAPGQVWRWLIVAHTASRWTVLPLCAWLPYARAEGKGKLVAKQIGKADIFMGSMTFFVAVLLLPWQAALAALLAAGLVTLLSGLFFRARLSGVTGDCLGAANQLTEVSLYLTAVILSRFDLL
jgi:adenosylcobinamide-GDP ribazoletransferase